MPNRPKLTDRAHHFCRTSAPTRQRAREMAPLLALLFLFLSGARRCSAAATASPSSPPPPPRPTPLVPALFVIGDSTADVGTNNYLGTLARADREPYGRDFDTHRPTGRFSNGRIPVDYLGNNNRSQAPRSFLFVGFRTIIDAISR